MCILYCKFKCNNRFSCSIFRCDADPSALARYVLALLKKDKNTKELIQCMNEQLDVFLGSETKPFLARLFDVIASEEYVNPQTATAPIQPVIIHSVDIIMPAISEQLIEAKAIQEPSNVIPDTSQNSSKLEKRHVKEATPPLGKNTNESDEAVNKSPLGSSINKLREVSPVRNAIESEHHDKMEPRQRNLNVRARSRSRSRTHRDKYNRQYPYRNKSPTSDGDRDSRRKGGNPFRRGGGGVGNIDGKSAKFTKRSQSPNDGNMSDSMTDRRGARSLSPVSKGDRCRDFDEKGYCMRGETCPWDHGVNPVVLEDINNPMISMQGGASRGGGGEYNPDAPELWTRGPFGNGAARAAQAGPAPVNLPGAYPRQPAGAGAGAAFRAGPPFSFGLNAGAITPLQRELISVPVVEANSGGDISTSQKRRYEPEDTVAVAEGPAKRKVPLTSRLGPPGRVALQQNCSLELRKVPRGLNSIAHLNNHFCKFGKIVNIQVSYEGDPEAAIITFSTHAEANVAYRSTEAVLNNRFIKVFWHISNGGGASVDGNHNSTSPANNVNMTNNAKDELNMANANPRKSNQYSLNNTLPATPTPTSTDTVKPNANSAAQAGGASVGTIAANSSLTKNNTANAQTTTIGSTGARIRPNRITRTAPENIRKKKEEQVKAAVQLAHGLHKRKHELLQGYLKQMRSCVEIVERMENTDSQRPALLTTVKTLQVNIDTLNKEIASDQAQITASITPSPAPVAHPYRKSKELQKKELLDIELELIAQQQEGNDTTAIQKRIEELQKSLVTVSKPTTFVARNARVRPAPPGSTSVDRRPTTIVVTGFAAEECDTILGHFKVSTRIDESLL